MRWIKFMLIAFVSFQVHGQSNSALHKPAPELDFLKIVNDEKSSAKLSDFKSKVVVLDFWATWCAPCIESFPHLEALRKKFKDDIQIIAITDESEERINTFLKKRSLTLPIAIDTDRILAGKFPHRSIPHTVVIDKNGIVRAITTPNELTDEVLKKIIEGQSISILEKKDILTFNPSRPLSENENFIYQVTITPYQDGLPSMSNTTGGDGAYKNRRILCVNLLPKTLYVLAYQFSPTRTVIEVKDRTVFDDWDNKKRIATCFDLIVPEHLGEMRFEIMKQQLVLLYDFKPTIQKRSNKVKVLKVKEGQTFSLKPSSGGIREVAEGGQGLTMKHAEVGAITSFLEDQIRTPVVDETGLKDLFTLELNWYNENPKQIHEELKKLGLELVDAIREIDVLVIGDK